MASPNTIKMNDSIPKPKHFGEIYIEGNPNNIKDFKLRLKRLTRGNTRGKRNGKNQIRYSGEHGSVPPKE